MRPVCASLNKILELDHELEAIAGLRYKVDSNHDLVYMEFDEPTITFARFARFFGNWIWSRALSARFRRNCGQSRKRNCSPYSMRTAWRGRASRSRFMIVPIFHRDWRRRSRFLLVSRRACPARGRNVCFHFHASAALEIVHAADRRDRFAFAIGRRHHRRIYRRGFRRPDLFSIQQTRHGLRRGRGSFGCDLPRAWTGSYRR